MWDGFVVEGKARFCKLNPDHAVMAVSDEYSKMTPDVDLVANKVKKYFRTRSGLLKKHFRPEIKLCAVL